MIRVLVVDDSAVARKSLAEVLTSDPEIQVIATAPILSSPPSAFAMRCPT